MYVFMGGTFDPVHEGHIQGALQVSRFLNDRTVHLLPAKIPVHKRAPSTETNQRIAMLELAVDCYQQLALDLREITALESSYTINTLRDLRKELGEAESIVMIIGMDSFLTLQAWHKSDEFLGLCHILVLQRPHYILESTHPFIKYRIEDKNKLLSRYAGHILFLTQPPFDISATEIRENINGNVRNVNIDSQLPKAVSEYIRKNNLYQKTSV